ncbi:aldehyde dehydrogenase family protein [Bifidobacterium sp. ESL0728]|uniref:aldehyde dehydrogenase family protein n=1 Tax=Bifidobacterium sp. ESL0728 TaxID=2983220 RepID=UPI0023F7FB1D|nr:aldehyde dehydrogenase family protein [Bifidobacterium sp. ESL0728]WEV59973.1 aldehyde dehydrogenase family protein [Bifidobacterium sp. ESL0728]
MNDTVARLHRTFNTGVTLPLAWRRKQLDSMERMLNENRKALEQAVYRDLGKPAPETALMEIKLVTNEIRFVGERLQRWTRRHPVMMPLLMQPSRGWTVAEPKGVVLVISPWNYPLMLSLEPMVDAIAAGNCVCLKPSELSPNTSGLLERLIGEYLDPRGFAVLQGAVPETTKLLRQPFDHIFYTGNGKVGSIVMEAAAKQLTPVTLELGGKSPVFVDASANLDVAAGRIAWGRFTNAGQTCVAPDYVLTTPELVEPLARKIAAFTRKFFGDNPAKSASYARIINTKQFDRLARLLPADGETFSGGETDREHLYIAPTVLINVRPDDPVMQEEIFGPILPILAVRNAAEAVAFINEREKPLALYVFTRSKTTRLLFERHTSSGALGFNLPLGHLLSSRLPFGGIGASGIGSYHGKAGFLEFSHVKTVTSKPTFPDTLRIAYPPYKRIVANKKRSRPSEPVIHDK